MVEPRLKSVPKSRSSKIASQAVELYADTAGHRLDDWQELPLRASLASPQPLKAAVNVARQNGKGEIIMARMLAGVFLLEEELQIYSAHEWSTAMEMFRRLEWLLEETPLWDEIKKNRRGQPQISWSHGSEGIEFRGNRRISFRTRTKGGGRGFSCDCLYLDEAMFISDAQHAALEPIVSARPRSQIWYLGSAVDQEVHDNGLVFSRLRHRAIKGGDPTLAYFEWSAGNGQPEKDHPNQLTEEMTQDMELARKANPALGIRIRPEIVAEEARGSLRSFAVERYGLGDWPNPDAIAGSVIRLEDWNKLLDPESEIEDAVDALAFDVSPSPRRASIAVVGANLQEIWHLEITDNHAGTSWLSERVAELVSRHRPRVVVCAAHSPAEAFVAALGDLGVKVQVLSVDEHAQACGRLVDTVEERGLRHPGGSVLAGAIRGAKSRPLGDAWLWSRRHSDVDISPLVAGTLALSAAIEGREASVYNDRGLIAI